MVPGPILLNGDDPVIFRSLQINIRTHLHFIHSENRCGIKMYIFLLSHVHILCQCHLFGRKATFHLSLIIIFFKHFNVSDYSSESDSPTLYLSYLQTNSPSNASCSSALVKDTLPPITAPMIYTNHVSRPVQDTIKRLLLLKERQLYPCSILNQPLGGWLGMAFKPVPSLGVD